MKSTDRFTSWQSGFTLVELMITCAIVAILVAVAVPMYSGQVARTNRGAAKACIAQYAQLMERAYTTAGTFTYVGSPGATPLPCTTEGNLQKRYTFAVSGQTATAYLITATPTTVQAARDSRCGSLTLNQAGVRSAGTGSAADIAYCW